MGCKLWNQRKRAVRVSPIIFITLLTSGLASADPTVVDFRIDNTNVELAAAGPHAFRLSVSADARSVPQTVFLADPTGQTQVAAEKVQDGSYEGIKTDSGELLIDPKSGEWTLRDSAGKTLIPPCRLGGRAKAGHVEINVGWPVDKPVLTYGGGNGALSLLQGEGATRVDNGRAVEPYYWTDCGYAAMAVGEDDNKPAKWSPSETGLTWTFSGRSGDLYLMPAASLYEAARDYSELSGPAAVPPEWAFGYLQSRWGWKDRAYIEDTLHNFVDRKLPVDAFIFDFEWYTVKPDYELPPEGEPDFKDFSFNPALFPDPAAQIAEMRANGVHFVGIRKPRLGNSDLLNMARAKGWLLPGETHVDVRNIDYRQKAVRDWYAEQLVDLLKAGVSGWWDDEGELTFSTYYWWNAAEAQALAAVNPTERLWTICRAFQPGLQRFGAAAWTGDIHANWQTLRRTPTDLLNWSLSGMDYGACDIGGFVGADTPQLLTRWMEAGVFFPIMRSHSDHKEQPRFPWLYGPEAEAAIHHALDLRYRLIPVYYSLAHLANETGAPIMRPLVMEFPDDPKAADLSSQWLIGSGLMAAPMLGPEDKRSVYLPADKWYEFDTNTSLDGGRDIDVSVSLDQIPVYVRAGTILPLAPPVQHTDQLPGGPLQLQIYPGKDAHFTLVEDDGHTTAYVNGQLRRTSFDWNDAARTLTWKVDGNYSGPNVFSAMQVTVFDPAGKKQAEGTLGASGQVQVGQ